MSRRSVYFDPPDLWDRVSEVAQAQDRSNSYIICRLLEAALSPPRGTGQEKTLDALAKPDQAHRVP